MEAKMTKLVEFATYMVSKKEVENTRAKMATGLTLAKANSDLNSLLNSMIRDQQMKGQVKATQVFDQLYK